MAEVNKEALERYIHDKSEAKIVVVALSTVGCGMGFTESDLTRKTGLEVQKIREVLHQLQYLEVIHIRCTQVGTSGPYDYYFTLKQGIKVEVKIEVKITN